MTDYRFREAALPGLDALLEKREKRIATLCEHVTDDEMRRFGKEVPNFGVVLDEIGVNALLQTRGYSST
jgi:hypothetical protein